MDPDFIDETARAQHGLITTRQALDAGANPSWIRAQVRARRLIPVRRGVYRVQGAPVTQDQVWLAAILAAGAATVLSHRSAAAAWALRGFRPPLRVDLLSESNRPRGPGIRGHETGWLPASDRAELRGVPVTTPARTLIDASGGFHPWSLGRIVDDALCRGIVTLSALAACFDDMPPSGRRPSAAMRVVLRDRLARAARPSALLRSCGPEKGRDRA